MNEKHGFKVGSRVKFQDETGDEETGKVVRVLSEDMVEVLWSGRFKDVHDVADLVDA